MTIDILFVDPDEGLREIYLRYFVRQGLSIDTAANVLEYRDKLQDEQPHILIIDIEMLNGHRVDQLQRALSESFADPPVVIVTGDETSAQLAAATGVCRTRCFQKPYSFIVLLDCVRALSLHALMSQQHSLTAAKAALPLNTTGTTVSADM